MKNFVAKRAATVRRSAEVELQEVMEFFCCPWCRGELVGQAQSSCCGECSREYVRRDGIYRFIDKARKQAVAAFNAKYDRIRLMEGWACDLPGYYEYLPYRDISGRHQDLWRLRARSFEYLLGQLRKTAIAPGASLLDLGAGSCWMSQRLGSLFRVFALDVNDGAHGLAAFPRQNRRYIPVQGEMQRLPFRPASFDVVIAGASLHYGRALHTMLGEVHRVLQRTGCFFVFDSPFYPTPAALQAAHGRTQQYYRSLGVADFAGHYGGILESDFVRNALFSFQKLRADASLRLRAMNWARMKLGRDPGAAFPFWIGMPK